MYRQDLDVTLDRENKDQEKGKTGDVIVARQGGQIRRQHKKRITHVNVTYVYTNKGRFFMNAPDAVSKIFVF
jgi:hypothetical protein